MGSPSTLTSSAMSRDAAPRLMTMSFSAVSRIFFPWQLPVASMSARDSNLNSPRQTHFQRARRVPSEGTAVRKPRPPMLTPRIGVCEPAICRGDVQHRAVAAENQQQIHLARQRGRRRSSTTACACRQRCDEPRGLAEVRGARGLLGIADEADALDFVSLFFQSAPKILCCPPGRAAGIPSHRASSSRAARRQNLPTPPARVRGSPGR